MTRNTNTGSNQHDENCIVRINNRSELKSLIRDGCKHNIWINEDGEWGKTAQNIGEMSSKIKINNLFDMNKSYRAADHQVKKYELELNGYTVDKMADSPTNSRGRENIQKLWEEKIKGE